MTLHIRDGTIHVAELHTRLPFRYGIATMTRTPHAFVSVEVEIDGQCHQGVAADHLPPKWFTKDPARGLDDEVDEMARVIEHAVQASRGMRGGSPFAVWRELWAAQADWGQRERLPPLLTHFGTSLVERALIEAFCRAAGQPFHRLLFVDQLGIQLGNIHAPLAGSAPGDLLPDRPLQQIIARHTVGLADPLTDGEIPAKDCLDDGLPQSLEACIRAYGLRHFKIKVNGEIQQDGNRLLAIARTVAENARQDFAFTLDGNEQFHSVSEFRDFWTHIQGQAGMKRFFERCLFVEQPLHRSVALEEQSGRQLLDWPDRPPLIIDESDGDLESLPRALALGYSGTSHKNCKGVFKGIANACLLSHLGRNKGRKVIMSGEDLVNIGPVALLQDLAVCAALGITSVERNGHHYFAGLSFWPPTMQENTLRNHGDLYRPSAQGWPRLNIHDGMIDLDSINAAPFGVGWAVPLDEIPTLDQWRRK